MNVNKYIGLPYANKGRSWNGLDCWGLVRLVYQEEYGIILPSYTEHYLSSVEAKEIAQLINGERGSWQEIPLGKEKAGDVIILRLLGSPMHVGVIHEPGIMLHVLEGVNAVLEAYTGTLWCRRISGIIRHGSLQ